MDIWGYGFLEIGYGIILHCCIFVSHAAMWLLLCIMYSLIESSLVKKILHLLCSWKQLGEMVPAEAMRLFVKLLEVCTTRFLRSMLLLHDIDLPLTCFTSFSVGGRKKILVGIQEHQILFQNL